MDQPDPTTPTGTSAMALAGRAIRGLLALVAVVAVLWSFGRVLSRPFNHLKERGGRTELTVLHWGDPDEDAIVRQLVATFEAGHPDVHVRRINANADYYAKLKTMCAAGEPPDVMFLNARDVSTYAGLGLLMDVGPLLKADSTGELAESDFFRPALDSFRFDGVASGRGRLYGVPSNFTGLGFYYNKSLFAKAGVARPTDDWTWEEFEAKSRAIGKLDGVSGCAIELTGDSVRAILKTFGLEIFSDDFGQVQVQDPLVVSALERVRGWTLGNDGPRVATATDPYDAVNSGSGLFALQKAAVYGPTGRWMVPELRKTVKFDWDFAPMPRGSQRGTILYVAAWCVSSATHHPQESWALAKALATPRGQAQLAETGLAIPSLRSVANSPAFLDPSRPPERDDLFLKDVDDAWPSMWPADSRFARRFSDHLQDCLRLGRRTVAQSMAAAEADWKQEQSSPLRTGKFRPAPWRWLGGVAVVLAGCLGALFWVWWRRPGPATSPARVREARAGLLMASPWMIGFAVFTIGPVLLSLALAFMRWKGLSTLDHAEWVGLLNFEQMFRRDPRFWHALGLTARYAAMGVPAMQGAALIAALLMAQRVPGVRVFRALWYLPSVLAGAGLAVMWRWVFDGEHGLLNAALRSLSSGLGWLLGPLGIRTPDHFPDWLGADADWAGVPVFVIASLWSIGGAMLIYLAGLQAIPRTLYEAAAIDGAGPVRRFVTVTFPMLGPVILFNVVIGLIGSFQVFTQAYVMTQGGPGDSTRFYVLYIFNSAFENHEMGYASAMAWILLLIILVLTALVLWQGRKRVHYEGLRA